MIPVVIIHKGYRPYVHKVCKITSITNKVILIGDESLKNVPENVEFVNIKEYEDREFKKYFINYSTNDSDYEYECFNRVFILKNFMKKHRNYEKVFHLDSDCVLLSDINKFNFTHEIAYCIPYNNNDYDLCASIHSALLNIDFCEAFENLYLKIYKTGELFKKIEDKIKWHAETQTSGGICDMTMYYILQRDYLNVQNLLNYGFMNNVNTSEGPDSKTQYLTKNGLMSITKDNEMYDIKNKKYVKLWNIHFQGGAKRFI